MGPTPAPAPPAAALAPAGAPAPTPPTRPTTPRPRPTRARTPGRALAPGLQAVILAWDGQPHMDLDGVPACRCVPMFIYLDAVQGMQRMLVERGKASISRLVGPLVGPRVAIAALVGPHRRRPTPTPAAAPRPTPALTPTPTLAPAPAPSLHQHIHVRLPQAPALTPSPHLAHPI